MYLRRHPPFGYQRAWHEIQKKNDWPKAVELRHSLQQEPQHRHTKMNVVPDTGEYGPEFVLTITLAQFKKAAKKENLDFKDEDLFLNFQRCLTASVEVYWDQVLEEKFTLATGATMPTDDVPPRKTTKTFFDDAIPALMEKLVGFPRSRDTLYRKWYVGWKKPGDMCNNLYLLRFREMIQACKYLNGGIAHPTELQMKEWFYLAQPNRHLDMFDAKFSDLDGHNLEELSSEFQKFLQKDMNDGTIDKIKKSREGQLRAKEYGQGRGSGRGRGRGQPRGRSDYYRGEERRSSRSDYHRGDDRRHESRDYRPRSDHRSRQSSDRPRDNREHRPPRRDERRDRDRRDPRDNRDSRRDDRRRDDGRRYKSETHVAEHRSRSRSRSRARRRSRSRSRSRNYKRSRSRSPVERRYDNEDPYTDDPGSGHDEEYYLSPVQTPPDNFFADTEPRKICGREPSPLVDVAAADNAAANNAAQG